MEVLRGSGQGGAKSSLALAWEAHCGGFSLKALVLLISCSASFGSLVSRNRKLSSQGPLLAAGLGPAAQAPATARAAQP